MVRRYFQLCVDLPKFIDYHGSFELVKKCDRLVFCTRDFLFSLAFSELVSANFNPCCYQLSYAAQHKCFENTVRKGEIAHNEQFIFFPQWFLSY